MEKIYKEPLEASEHIRKLYKDGIDRAIEMMYEHSKLERESNITPEKMASDRDFLRKVYAHQLGIDRIVEIFGNDTPECEFSYVGEDEAATIERLKIKIADGVFFTGILLTPKLRDEKAPLAVMSHGGGGSPELCCDMLGKNNYDGVVRKMLEHGIIVFAHQLLLWNLKPVLCESTVPQYTVEYNRMDVNRKLLHCGTSIAAFEIYCISRALDCLLALPHVDTERCGMIGLSYGGFYTLYTMAYETRIKLGQSSAAFNDRRVYDWHDMIWHGSAALFSDSEAAGLCAPRKLIIDIGREDSVFDYKSGEALEGRVREFFRAADCEENLRFNVWDGAHKISLESLDLFIKQLID